MRHFTRKGRLALIRMLKNRVWTPEMRKKASESHRGLKHSPETIAKFKKTLKENQKALGRKLTNKQRHERNRKKYHTLLEKGKV